VPLLREEVRHLTVQCGGLRSARDELGELCLERTASTARLAAIVYTLPLDSVLATVCRAREQASDFVLKSAEASKEFPDPDPKTVEAARQAAREGRGSTIDEILKKETP